MAFDAEKARPAYVVLVRIYTDFPGTYVALATESVVVGSTFYDGRVVHMSRFREAYPREFRSAVPLPDITLRLANPDSFFDAGLEENFFWAHRQVEIFCWERGTGLNAASDLVFRGYVQYPGAMTLRDDVVEVRLTDYREPFNETTPPHSFDEADYPHMDPSIEDEPIPLLYGDFTDELAPNRTGVEAFCIDTGVRDGEQEFDPVFKICQPTGSAIGYIGPEVAVSRMSEEVTYAETTQIDLDGTGPLSDPGTFALDRDTWTGSGDYAWQEGDRFFVQARGNVTESGLLIDNPAQVIRDLISSTNAGGPDDIDTAGYMAAYTYFEEASPYHRVRRQITRQADLWDIVAELAQEVGIDVSNRNGKVYLLPWQPYLASDSPDGLVLGERDILPDSFEMRIDPDEGYTDRIVASFNWDAQSDSFLDKMSVSSVGVTGAGKTRELEFRWSYYRVPVAERIQRLVWLFSQPLRYYEFETGVRAIPLLLGDRVRLTYPRRALDGRSVQIRSIQKDFSRGVVKIRAIDAFLRGDIGRWTADDAPGYQNASDDERKEQGFWTNEDGEADPGDSGSAMSHWL